MGDSMARWNTRCTPRGQARLWRGAGRQLSHEQLPRSLRSQAFDGRSAHVPGIGIRQVRSVVDADQEAGHLAAVCDWRRCLRGPVGSPRASVRKGDEQLTVQRVRLTDDVAWWRLSPAYQLELVAFALKLRSIPVPTDANP